MISEFWQGYAMGAGSALTLWALLVFGGLAFERLEEIEADSEGDGPRP